MVTTLGEWRGRVGLDQLGLLLWDPKETQEVGHGPRWVLEGRGTASASPSDVGSPGSPAPASSASAPFPSLAWLLPCCPTPAPSAGVSSASSADCLE